MKKLLVLCLAFVLMFASVGCSSGSDNGGRQETIDPNKTQLNVSNYNGGYGTEWLYAVKDRFEKEYANTSFEEDKTGVQIVVHSDKDGYLGRDLYQKMGITTDDVFFSESITFNDYVSSGYMLDINDVITEVNFDGKTIESKMSEEQKNALKINGSYYCVPHYAAFTGINYDIDLFNSKKLYYAKDGAPSEANYIGTAKYTNLAGEKSAGPDGQYETYDDGLPATYDEFFALCGYMKNTKGITPFYWNGEYRTTYTNWILAALATDYEGKEQMRLNYDFTGTAKNLVTVSDSGITFDADDTEIVNSNGYELYRSAGRYYALKFFENILKNDGYYHTDGFDGDVTNVTAQRNYLRSSQKGEPIAMLLEGIWWENEATDTFTSMAKRYGDEYAMANRRFGIMPMPKVSNDKIGEKTTLLDNNASYAFIRKNIDPKKVELAKLFLKYCYTDESLKEFTTIVGLPKALSYDMGTDAKWKSAYSKNVWDLYANSDRVYPISQNKLYLNNQSAFVYFDTFITARQKSALEALYSGVSAESYFSELISFRNKTYWENTFKRFF